MADKLVTEYCLSCLYCRRFTYGERGDACHYTHDTGKNRRCPPGDGCTYRVIATDEERRIQARKALAEIQPRAHRTRDAVEDDYIFGRTKT